jgi:hypothetical protein
MHLQSFLTIALGATALALPSNPDISRRQCQLYETISDPGFYVAASIPSSDFPDDPPYFENQILQWQPSNGGDSCTLMANFENGFPVTASGDIGLNVYTRGSSTNRNLIGSLAPLPVAEDGTLDDIVSSPIATFPCSSTITLEFELSIDEAGSYASLAFMNNFESGFFILSC